MTPLYTLIFFLCFVIASLLLIIYGSFRLWVDDQDEIEKLRKKLKKLKSNTILSELHQMD